MSKLDTSKVIVLVSVPSVGVNTEVMERRLEEALPDTEFLFDVCDGDPDWELPSNLHDAVKFFVVPGAESTAIVRAEYHPPTADRKHIWEIEHPSQAKHEDTNKVSGAIIEILSSFKPINLG